MRRSAAPSRNQNGLKRPRILSEKVDLENDKFAPALCSHKSSSSSDLSSQDSKVGSRNRNSLCTCQWLSPERKVSGKPTRFDMCCQKLKSNGYAWLRHPHMGQNIEGGVIIIKNNDYHKAYRDLELSP